MRGIAITGRSLAWAVPVLAEAAALGRAIALAWAIGPEELGRAMMLVMAVRLVEMATDVGVDRLIIQAPDGNSADFQSQLHGTLLVRGMLGAVLLLGLAPLLAVVFSDGPNINSYALLAIIPFLRGFGHLDFRRLERRFRYKKMSIVEGGATACMVLCVMPSVWVLGDHRAMCLVLAAHAVSHTAFSHLVADRKYQARFSQDTLRRSWRFGAPLLLNAGLLFLTFYADRLIVAQAYGWTSLAVYGVALQLALLPSQIIGRAAASVVLPELRAAHDSGALQCVWVRCLNAHLILAAVVALGFAVCAPTVIAFMYGEALRPEPVLIAALAIAAGFRVLRTPYSQLAVAAGRTGDPARANIIRALALIPAVACAAAGLPLDAIAVAAALGEAGATYRAIQLSSTTLAHRNQKDAFV